MNRLRRLVIYSFIVLIFTILLAIGAQVYAGPQTVSSTTTATMFTNVRSYLKAVSENSVSDTMWSDTELLVWLNDGSEDIAGRTLCYQSIESVTLVASTIEYSLSTDYIKVLTARYVDASSVTTGLKEGNIWSVGNITDVGQPAYWYEFGGKIGIYPTLSAVTTQTVKAYLAKRPAAITAGQTVLLPAIYDKALTLYIVAQALLKDGQVAKYTVVNQEYLQELDRYRQDLTNPDKEKAKEAVR